jgi:hypothetical protein
VENQFFQFWPQKNNKKKSFPEVQRRIFFPKWNCVERWKMFQWWIDFWLNSYFFVEKMLNEWNFPFSLIFPKSFPNISCIYTILTLLVFVNGVRHNILLTSLSSIPPIEMCRNLLLAMRRIKKFPGERENVSGGCEKKENFPFAQSERSYISLRPGQVVLSASRVW